MLTEESLKQFTGTERWYRHKIFVNNLYTEGVRYLADRANAYWLIDEIVFAQFNPYIKKEHYQIWTLRKLGERATLKCEDATETCILFKTILTKKFPLESVELYFVDNVILLPSEY